MKKNVLFIGMLIAATYYCKTEENVNCTAHADQYVGPCMYDELWFDCKPGSENYCISDTSKDCDMVTIKP